MLVGILLAALVGAATYDPQTFWETGRHGGSAPNIVTGSGKKSSWWDCMRLDMPASGSEPQSLAMMEQAVSLVIDGGEAGARTVSFAFTGTRVDIVGNFTRPDELKAALDGNTSAVPDVVSRTNISFTDLPRKWHNLSLDLSTSDAITIRGISSETVIMRCPES